jgi:soluble lytic murein transglycosylase-like protein
MRLLVKFLALLMMTGAAFSADLAVLRNGFSIRHERRQEMGAMTRLYLNLDGSNYADVPTTQIEHFEEAPPLPVADPAETSQKTPVILEQAISASSERHRIDPDLIASVIRAESAFNPHAVSPKGAQGLMQLMPKTASRLGVENPFDPQANVEGGTRYLRELLVRYNFDLIKALAAYNAGPLRVEQYGGVPPYRETRAYVARIVRDFNNKKLAERKGAATSKKPPQASVPHSATSQQIVPSVKQQHQSK